MKKITFYLLVLVGFCISTENTLAQCSSYADFNYFFNGRHITFVNSSYLDSASKNQARYEWDFGDSSTYYTNNTNNVSHSYTQIDTFSVQLIIFDSLNNCNDTVQKSIPITFSCISLFDVSTHLDTGFFKYTGATPNMYFNWHFYDSTYFSKDVVRKFPQSGKYSVLLEVFDSSFACTDTLSKEFIIHPFCKADFSYSISNDTVKFTSQASNFTTVDWSFGDGTTSNTLNPVKVYSSVGNYMVCQTVEDSLDQCVDTFCDTLIFCEAGFTYSIAQDTVRFTNTSSGSDIQWNFGDGTVSNSFNPAHIYDSSGTYVVCQTINDSLNHCSNTFCDTILVKVPDPCQAGFNYTSSRDTVLFSSTALNYDSIYWEFGDGFTSSDNDPMHIYSSRGSYLVCQKVYNSQRNCSSVLCDSVDVIFCNASFSFSVNDSQVTFTNHSNNLNADFRWDFGDGNFSTASNPTHIYRSTGTYVVNLSMTDSSSGMYCKAIYTDSLNVSVLCEAHYNIAIDSNQLFKIYLINNSSDYNSHEYHWDFGDGATANKRTPKHQYNAFGKYQVCLSIEDSLLNCISTFCDSLGLDSNGVLLRGGFLLEVLDQSIIGINENDLMQKIAVYPNPVNDLLYIDLSEISFELSLFLYDLNGRLIFNKESKAASIEQIDLGSQVSGMYLLIIKDNQNNQVFKKIIHQ